MAKVLVTLSGQILKEIVINDDTTRIGREETNHIQINNVAVSRHHAEISRQGRIYYLEDRKSTNGTLLNGQGVAGKVALDDNDKIGIGTFVLIFRLEPRDFPERITADSANPYETICFVAKK